MITQIKETLVCLNGAIHFSGLDLKSGYWLVELEEEAKPLIGFTVGSLAF